MNENIFEEIIALIEEKSGLERKLFKPSTKLETDLGISGDDAVDLILAYGKKFNVDVSNFMLADYFDGEGLDSFGWIIDLLKGKTERVPNKILTIEHLIKGIKAGKLNEEVINS